LDFVAVEGNAKIAFAAWDEDRDSCVFRRIFILNTDLNGEKHSAKFLLGESEWNIPVPSGIIRTVYICNNIAVLPETPLSSVIEIKKLPEGKFEIILQTIAADSINIFKPDSKEPVILKIGSPGIHKKIFP